MKIGRRRRNSFYKEHGYVHMQNIVPQEYLQVEKRKEYLWLNGPEKILANLH